MSTPIIVQEVRKNENGFVATVQFDPQDAPHEVAIANPFSEQEEKRLEWYFERWLTFPFTDQVPAKEAADSIRAYGEDLFKQVFGSDRNVIVEYDRLRQKDFHLVIVGSPEFHSFHWEALRDPLQERPLSVDKPIVRKNSRPVTYRAEAKQAPRLRVLLVTARPGGKRDVSYRTISRPLVEALETGKIAARIDMVRPGTFEALVNHLEDVRDEHGDGYYHIIHLDMHGALLTYEQYRQLEEEQQIAQYAFRGEYAQNAIEEYQGLRAFLFFNDTDDNLNTVGNPVSADDLARLLNMRQIPIVVLNACQSAKQIGDKETSLGSRMLDAGAQLVVAMGYSVTVSAAGLLMTTLYRQLLDGKDPAVAIRRGRLELFNNKRRRAAFDQEIKLEDWMLPVVYQNRAPGFDRDTFQGQVAAADATYAAPRTTYRFVGRDIDILEIESRLLLRRNILLVRGMGGAGKTTLLHHLGWWWQKTRFVTQVFYFGYDLKAYHLPEIVNTVGGQLGLSLSGRAADDRAAVLHSLKSTRHLLVLDNMESITGEPLAVPNTLPQDARDHLREFLQELAGGRTLVLLGSRGGEAWLRPDPLRDIDIYDLPGLDYEAQTELAEAILRNANAPRYPEQADHQADFRRLLELLGGYPLAMEVVLAGLAQSTPSQIIERLQAADINLDNQKETASKTDSILKCIDYSHSNLSKEAQALLLCLAPFTGVMNIGWLEQYTNQLKARPALAELPYERWQDVFQEAINWGLLQPHEQLGEMGYLSLQPIFPYFLKTRLNDESLSDQKKAVEGAFGDHYNGIGGRLHQAVTSKEAREKQTGRVLIGVEYENLMTSVHYALSSQSDFYNQFEALFRFLYEQQQFGRIIDLCRVVIAEYDKYSEDRLSRDQLYVKFYLVRERLAGTFLQTKNYQEAHAGYEDALAAIDTLGKDYQNYKGNVLHNLGRVAQEQRQWEAAEGYYKDALKIKIEFNDRHSQAMTLHQLGIVAQEQRQWEAAEGYYKDALKIKIEFNDRHSQARTLHQLGMVAQEQRQWEAAEGYYKDALKICIEFNDRYSQASTLGQLGNMAQEQRQWEAAEGYYKDALKIYIEFNDRHSQASTLHNLGSVAQEQRQWEAAEGYYKDALKIYIEFNDRYEQAGTLHQLGRVAQEQRQWEAAEGYYKDALKIKIEFNDRHSQARTLHQLGIVAQEQRQWEAAEGYYKDALKIYIEFNDRHSQAGTLHQLGRVAQEQRQWEAAVRYGLEAAEIFIQYRDEHNLGIVLRGLSRVWKEVDDRKIPEKLGGLLGMTTDDAETMLQKLNKSED